MATVIVPKFKHHVQEYYVTLGPVMRLRCSPVEWDSAYVQIGGAQQHYDDYVSSGTSLTAQMIDDDTYTDPLTAYQFRSYRSQASGLNARLDITMLSFTSDGLGFEAEFTARSSDFLHTAIVSRRCIKVYVGEFTDAASGANRGCFFSQHLFTLFIKELDGIRYERGPNGQEIINFSAATIHHFIQNSEIAKLSYMAKAVSDAERADSTTRPRTDIGLGFTPSGSGPFTNDRLAGFSNWIDAYTVPATTLLSPQRANELHFLGTGYAGGGYGIGGLATGCSLSRGFLELVRNHIHIDVGDGFKGMMSSFNVDIQTETDPETDVVTFDFGPGSIINAGTEAAANGNWRFWFDGRSGLHYQLDYCNTLYTDLPAPFLHLTGGKSLMGQFRPAIASLDQRQNRVALEGQWSNTFVGSVPPIQYQAFSPNSHAVYPKARRAFQGGHDSVIQGYHGKQVQRMAASNYAKLSQLTTAEWNGMPYVSLAIASYNRLIGVELTSPLEGYDWLAGHRSPIADWSGNARCDADTSTGMYGGTGKLFVAESVSGQNQDPEAPGGGSFLCNLGLKEVFALPADVTTSETNAYLGSTNA